MKGVALKGKLVVEGDSGLEYDNVSDIDFANKKADIYIAGEITPRKIADAMFIFRDLGLDGFTPVVRCRKAPCGDMERLFRDKGFRIMPVKRK